MNFEKAMKENRVEAGQEATPPPAVCGRAMTTDIDWYPRAEYQDRTIYFCTEFCLEAFKADPDRFYIAHSQKKDKRTGN